MVVSNRIEAMHAIELYSARDIRRLPLNQEQIQLDNNRKRLPYSVFAIVFLGAMRYLTRLERWWYVRGYLPTKAGNIDNEYNEEDPFFSKYYFLLTTDQKRNFNRCMMIACMRCGRAVFNNYQSNEQLAWSIRANKSNALPILGLYTQRPPQLQGRIDDSWKVHLYSDTIYCFWSIIYSLKHIINQNNEAQNRPKWTGGGD